jgi:16S rRNA (guanine(527)-N(7))-methyltransferase RsmG
VNKHLASNLRQTLNESGIASGRPFSESEIAAFCSYYELVVRWNPRLHLTTLTDSLLFARRHIIESAFAVSCLHPSVEKVWDFGSGAGVPGIPFAILRPDLKVILVEANRKKSVFLKEVADRLRLGNVSVLNLRFESLTEIVSGDCITVRAIDAMGGMCGKLLEIGQMALQILIFGNSELESGLLQTLPPSRTVRTYLLPFSTDRRVISLLRST